MGTRQSTKGKQQDKHPFDEDTEEVALKKETDESSFAKLPTPTSPDDLNHGTATASQGPTKLIRHSVDPSNGKQAIFNRMQQVPAVDVPQNREKGILTTGNISQHCPPKPGDQTINITADSQVLHIDAPAQVECSEVVRDVTAENVLNKDAEVKMKPTEPPNHSTQMSNQPNIQVSNEENASQDPGLNHSNLPNMISVNYQYCFRDKSETSRANAAKMRLRQKLEIKKLKAQPQDGSKSSQQTAEESVTVQQSSQQQCYTATRAKNHKKLQHSKVDCDTSVKAPEPQNPVATPNITATHHPTDATVKSGLQGQHKVSQTQDTAVKPKKKCTFIELNQNQPKGNAGNVTMEENMNGNNGHAGKEERPDTDFTPTQNLEHKVHAEGRWHSFTVNHSCPRKAHCNHNPGTGLPSNVQKWFDECPNYLCEPPRVPTAKLTAWPVLRETQEERGDSHQ
ncbi:uncharacterized protein LOC122983371 isoform X1 [Scomber scombrus]|uniref:Uncharacterized protein LOC122983371 isoform X1 n=1 Tax=Scomber scombrus TaxID=13677 RepID=A0AAV1NG36_SCOSC